MCTVGASVSSTDCPENGIRNVHAAVCRHSRHKCNVICVLRPIQLPSDRTPFPLPNWLSSRTVCSPGRETRLTEISNAVIVSTANDSMDKGIVRLLVNHIERTVGKFVPVGKHCSLP